MNAQEMIWQLKAELFVLPEDECFVVEAKTYNACGWPEAPAVLRNYYGYRWWPQVVLALIGKTYVATRGFIEKHSEDEDGSLLILTPLTHVVPVHSCGNPRCVNPAYVINPDLNPVEAKAALDLQSDRVVWAGHGADSHTKCVRKRTEPLRKASKAYAGSAGGSSVEEAAAAYLSTRSQEDASVLFACTYKALLHNVRTLTREAFEVSHTDRQDAEQYAFMRLWEVLLEGKAPEAPEEFQRWAYGCLANFLRRFKRYDGTLTACRRKETGEP